MAQALRAVLACGLFIYSAHGGVAFGQETPREGPRNVLLLVADDLGTHLGCYGDAGMRTPRIDGLAARGTRFEQAFATVASCSASRAVILTGMYTHQNGQYGHAHQPYNLHTHGHVQSLPRVLRGAGYRTAVLGKLHVLPPEVYPLEDVTTPGVNQRMPEAHGAAARAFFEQDKDKPFLLLVGIHDPHRSARGFGKASPSPRDPAKVELPRYLSDTVETRRDWAAYLDAIERLDASVGSVLDALDASGRANETLVMFLSDNGPPFPGAKTTLYDPGIRLPLLVARPGEDASSAGRATQALASWVDIAPTALAWAKVPAPESMTGRSLLPLTEDPGASGWERDAVFGSFVFHEITNYYPMRMIRTGKYKLIKNLTPALEFPFASDLHASPSWQSVLERGLPQIGERPVEAYLHRPALELYDLEQDPGETRNLAGEESRRSTVETLERRLLEWRISTKDPWLIPAFDARARVPTW